MTALKIVELTQELAQFTNKTYIVIDAFNDGGSSNWPISFPSLDEEQKDALGEPFVIPFNSRSEAQEFYTKVCRDLTEGSKLVSGWVIYISCQNGETEKITFDSSSDEVRPVYENGELTWEEIFD